MERTGPHIGWQGPCGRRCGDPADSAVLVHIGGPNSRRRHGPDVANAADRGMQAALVVAHEPWEAYS